MKIVIPKRHNAPATNLYADVITASGSKLGDRKIILLLPGGPGGNHTVFNSIQAELLQHGDLVLFDPRGCGYSDVSDTEYCSMEHYIEDIDAIRQHFKLSQIILLGGSYGAMTALGYAIKYGQFLEKLILLAGAPSYRFLETAKENLTKRGTSDQIKAAENLFDGTFKNTEHFKEYYQITSSLYLFNPPEQKSTPPTIAPNIPYNIAVTNFGFSDFLRKFNFEPNLKDIHCQTLIIVGENDWINDPSHAKHMADHIPNAKLIMLEKCGHFVWVDQRKQFFQALDTFLEDSLPQKKVYQ